MWHFCIPSEITAPYLLFAGTIPPPPVLIVCLRAGATAQGSSAPGKVASHRGDERQRLTAAIIRFSLGKSGRGQGTKIKLCEVRHCKSDGLPKQEGAVNPNSKT